MPIYLRSGEKIHFEPHHILNERGKRIACNCYGDVHGLKFTHNPIFRLWIIFFRFYSQFFSDNKEFWIKESELKNYRI